MKTTKKVFDSMLYSVKLATTLAFFMVVARPATAEEISVAVASNFMAPMQKIVAQFELKTGNKVLLSFGASGNFYAQIVNGAPYDAFLSADQETPAKLDKKGYVVSHSGFTYAIGKLVLWSPTPGLVDAQGDVLKSDRFMHLAVANAQLAPYGRAAVEVLTKLGVLDGLGPRLVTGENIAQAYQFVSSGNAELGFVALSQVQLDGKIEGSVWRIPDNFYTPIRQDAVLLLSGQGKSTAVGLLNYLKTSTARAVMQSYGYETP